MSNSEHTCLVELAKKWDGPFSKPIRFDPKTGDFLERLWSVKVFNHTPSGNISKVGGGQLLINFCPVCGQDLREDKEQGDDDG